MKNFELDSTIANKKGIYIAYPLADDLQSIYKPKNYKTTVNKNHTKIGITVKAFKSRAKCYYDNFGTQFKFIPIFILNNDSDILAIEKKILEAIKNELPKRGRSREWFETDDRERIINIAKEVLIQNEINHQECVLGN
tara:strand:- start:137 stop:550 length:414 start_codon:yes stop_codon:yes gene_type:complete